MNISKTLAAAITATSIIGGVGFAVAQTTTEMPTYPKDVTNMSTVVVDRNAPAAQSPMTAPPADTRTAVIDPANTQKTTTMDAAAQPPVEGSQGTQSGATPSTGMDKANMDAANTPATNMGTANMGTANMDAANTGAANTGTTNMGTNASPSPPMDSNDNTMPSEPMPKADRN